MTDSNSVIDPTRIREAKRLGGKLLPGMPFEDRLKVAEVALSNYGRVAQTYPVDHEQVRTDISRELRALFNRGERWAGHALVAYICKVCFDARADLYEPIGHRQVCGVTASGAPAPDRVFHRAARVQHHGGSWDLNVYVAQCGVTNLTNGSRGSIACSECFQ